MPLGIGKLKSLHTLSKIIIGGDNGFAITKLKDFKNLHGEVAIKGLDKVQNSMHAREAYFSQKRLTNLELEWSNVSDGSRNETLEYAVLNEMKPHNDNLKNPSLVSYGGVVFPKWAGDPLFPRLTDVTLRGCEKCTSLPPLGQLPSLKQLSVQGMHEVKEVGSDLLGTSLAFPSLEFLSFHDMQGWEVWPTYSGVVFPRLQELFIKSCPNLVGVSIEALPSLRVLEVKKCGFGVLTSLVQVASSVTMLKIESVFGLTNETWEGVMKYLREVEELRIQECNELRYLWKSEVEASKVIVNIRNLEVWNCDNLVSLGEKEEDNVGSSLTSLRI